MSRYVPLKYFDLAGVIAAGRQMSCEEATEVVRRAIAKSSEVNAAELNLAYATLAYAWAAPLGLTRALDGWWRLTGLRERGDDFTDFLPGDRSAPWASTLWTRHGRAVAYVSQPLGVGLELWKEMESWARRYTLDFAVFDRRGWSEPDRSVFVVWEPRGDWDSVIAKMKDVPRIPRPSEPKWDGQLYVQRE